MLKGGKLVAFSLIEVCIVLVCISLLIFAITKGVVIINDTKAKQVIVEVDVIKKAFYNFNDINDGILGDYSYDTIFNRSSSASESVPTTLTGNGDYIIRFGGSTYNESLLVWYHLSLFNSDIGNVSRSSSSYLTNATINTSGSLKNALPSKIASNAGYTILTYTATTIATSGYGIPYDSTTNSIIYTIVLGSSEASTTTSLVGTDSSTTTNSILASSMSSGVPTSGTSSNANMLNGPSLDYSTAIAIDKKIDDGSGSSGMVAFCTSNRIKPSCSTSGNVVIGFGFSLT